jgi:hypothetical protein
VVSGWDDSACLLAAFTRGIDARGYARNVLCELLCALGIYLHVFGHCWCRVMMGFATCSPAVRLDEYVRSAVSVISPLGTRATAEDGGHDVGAHMESDNQNVGM